MKNLFFTALLLALCGLAQAQPGSGGPAPGAVVTPIDGGASLLLASGLALGLKRLRQRRRAQA